MFPSRSKEHMPDAADDAALPDGLAQGDNGSTPVLIGSPDLKASSGSKPTSPNGKRSWMPPVPLGTLSAASATGNGAVSSKGGPVGPTPRTGAASAKGTPRGTEQQPQEMQSTPRTAELKAASGRRVGAATPRCTPQPQAGTPSRTSLTDHGCAAQESTEGVMASPSRGSPLAGGGRSLIGSPGAGESSMEAALAALGAARSGPPRAAACHEQRLCIREALVQLDRVLAECEEALKMRPSKKDKLTAANYHASYRDLQWALRRCERLQELATRVEAFDGDACQETTVSKDYASLGVDIIARFFRTQHLLDCLCSLSRSTAPSATKDLHDSAASTAAAPSGAPVNPLIEWVLSAVGSCAPRMREACGPSVGAPTPRPQPPPSSAPAA